MRCTYYQCIFLTLDLDNANDVMYTTTKSPLKRVQLKEIITSRC